MTRLWSERRMKHLANPVTDAAISDDDGPYVGLENIASWTGVIDLCQSSESKGAKGNRFRPGDVLFAKLRPYLAKVAIPDFSGHCSGEALVLRSSPGILPEFLRYRLVEIGTISAVNAATYGTKMPRASWDIIANLTFAVPLANEQKSIVDFLDRQTARIDRLIKKKQRLVELVGEKRSALITAAVTGEIDPMKGERQCRVRGAAEGVSDVMKIRHIVEVMNSNVDKVTLADEMPVRLCNYVDVYKNDYIESGMSFMAASATEAELGKFRLCPGDVIITKDSEDRLDIGVPALVRSTAKDLVCGYHLTLLRPDKQKIRGDYLFWALQSLRTRDEFSNATYGITRFGLSLGGIKSVAIRSPSLCIQKSIANFLDRETGCIDALTAKVLSSMDRLREFRSALITAAVTGQIDVTNADMLGQVEHRLAEIEETRA